MENLISFDKLADVANNLINKLSDGIGWIVNHDTPRRIAIDTYITEIQNSDNDPLVKAALISNAKKCIKEYCNQYNVVGYAINNLSPSAKVELIDEDWLAYFMDKTRLVSNNEIQLIWGQILASECNVPGSIPKSLLSILAQIDSKIAKDFVAVASVSVWYTDDGNIDWIPVIINDDMDFYKSIGITYNALLELSSLGLIKEDFGFGNEFCVTFDKETTVNYHDQEYKVDANTNFPVGSVLFTNAGRSLCSAIITEKIDDFFENHCIPHWEKIILKK